MILILITGDRASLAAWTADDVGARLIHAMKLDRISPRIARPKAPGSAHPTIEYSREERDERNEWALKELAGAESPLPLIRAERDFMDATLGWFSYLGDESEAVRRTFAAWLKGKAIGYGGMKHWQAKHGVANGSVAHARKRCVAAIVARLNAEGVAKVAIPNADRFGKPLRKAA